MFYLHDVWGNVVYLTALHILLPLYEPILDVSGEHATYLSTIEWIGLWFEIWLGIFQYYIMLMIVICPCLVIPQIMYAILDISLYTQYL